MGVSCFSFLFAMFMLIWLQYTKVQHNNHKTIFKIIFFANSKNICIYRLDVRLKKALNIILILQISNKVNCLRCNNSNK